MGQNESPFLRAKDGFHTTQSEREREKSQLAQYLTAIVELLRVIVPLGILLDGIGTLQEKANGQISHTTYSTVQLCAALTWRSLSFGVIDVYESFSDS